MTTMLERNTKPKKVQRAVILLYAAVALTLITAIIGWIRYFFTPTAKLKSELHQAASLGAGFLAKPTAFLVSGVLLLLLHLALAVFLIEMIKRRRNWARIVILALLLLSLPRVMLLEPRMFTSQPLSVCLDWARFAFICIALILLYRPESSKWFTSAFG